MQIQNPRATEVIREEAGLTLSEGFPQTLSSNIIPIIDMTPSFHAVVNIANTASSTTTGAITILNPVNEGDLYITGAHIALVKDAACDMASGRVTLAATINGVVRSILSIPVLTLTAQQQSLSISFVRPIKVDKGTSVTLLTNSFAAGNLIRSGGIVGYTVQ